MAGPFYNTSRLSRNHGIQVETISSSLFDFKDDFQDFGVKETEDWVRIISYRLLMCLGDLSTSHLKFIFFLNNLFQVVIKWNFMILRAEQKDSIKWHL